MAHFTIKCSQRGCLSTFKGDAAPKKCPVCRNPLLKGNCVETKPTPRGLAAAVLPSSVEPVTMPGADDPEPFAVIGALQTGEGAATVNTDDTGPSESHPA